MGYKFQSALVVSLVSSLCYAEPPLVPQQPLQQLTQPNPLGTRYSASTDVSHFAFKSPLLTLGSLSEVHLPAEPLIDAKGALRNDLKFGDEIQRYGKLSSQSDGTNNQLNSENTLATVANPVENSQQINQPQPLQNSQQQLYQQQINNQIYQQQLNQIQASQQQQQFNPYQLDQFQQYNQLQQLNQLNQLQQLSQLQNGQQVNQYASIQPQVDQLQQYSQLNQPAQQYSQVNPQLQQYNQLNQLNSQLQQYNQPGLNFQPNEIQQNSIQQPKVRVAFTNGLSNFNYGF